MTFRDGKLLVNMETRYPADVRVAGRKHAGPAFKRRPGRLDQSARAVVEPGTTARLCPAACKPVRCYERVLVQLQGVVMLPAGLGSITAT